MTGQPKLPRPRGRRRWTSFAVDRTTRQWAVAQGPRQVDTAPDAYNDLYEPESLT